jgi:hypothetical protein
MKYRLPFALLTICIGSAITAHAATISAGTATLVTSNATGSGGTAGPYRLSVFDGKASFRPAGASSSTTLGDGTLLDYRFVTSTTASGGSFPTYADSGSGNRISTFTAPTANISTSAPEDSWVNFWTTNDPGTNFSSVTPNFNDSEITHARANRANGTIDITDLTSGTLFFVHGNFLSQTEIVLTMSGIGQTNVVRTYLDTSKVNTNRGWITNFDFDNSDGLYDTITFAYRTDLDGDGSVTRGRFAGVMLDAIPEPSTSLLILGSLAGFCLRRRR